MADSGTISKSTIQLQYIDQWRGKALHGQWPNVPINVKPACELKTVS